MSTWSKRFLCKINDNSRPPHIFHTMPWGWIFYQSFHCQSRYRIFDKQALWVCVQMHHLIYESDAFWCNSLYSEAHNYACCDRCIVGSNSKDIVYLQIKQFHFLIIMKKSSKWLLNRFVVCRWVWRLWCAVRNFIGGIYSNSQNIVRIQSNLICTNVLLISLLCRRRWVWQIDHCQTNEDYPRNRIFARGMWTVPTSCLQQHDTEFDGNYPGNRSTSNRICWSQ